MKNKYLKFWDILIITIIMFAPAIISSITLFFSTPPEDVSKNLEFSSADNIRAIITQSIQLFIAFLYLWKRKFDFSQWKYKFSLKATLWAVGLFILVSILMDIVTILSVGWQWIPSFIQTNSTLQTLSQVNILLIIFSLLNGFYEEIYFLGICTMVPPKYQPHSFIFSLFIRFIFHTYQGLISAFGICIILGCIYFYFYKKKSSNLYIYTVSHSIADTFGLSFIHFL